MKVVSGEIVYVYIQDLTSPIDLPQTLFFIFKNQQRFIFGQIEMTICKCIHILNRKVVKPQKYQKNFAKLANIITVL